MDRIGVIGLGDMGSGLAKNLMKAGFEVAGLDLKPERRAAFAEMGGTLCDSAAEVGRGARAVFVMVMNGEQAREVILDPQSGLVASLQPGAAVILSATIKPAEAAEIGGALDGTGIHLIDTPVSGGFPGAQAGTLTMMAAAPDAVLDAFADVMGAVSATIWRVGTEPGQGQTVKACLQSLLGAMFSATCEAAAMAAKAGISGEAFYNVVANSSGGCGVTTSALGNIIDRKFEGTGSHIATMHKDLTISMAVGQELGAPLFTAAAAMQVFQAGKTRYPDGDNWVTTRIFEEIVGAELHRDGARKTR